MPTVIPLSKLPDATREAIALRGVSRTTCPRCGGGQSREISLSVRPVDHGLIKLSCWRVSCGWYALVLVDGSSQWEWSARKMPAARVFSDPVYPLAGKIRDTLAADYGLDVAALDTRGWRMAKGDKSPRLVIPIKNRMGQCIGHLTRTFDKPKIVSTYKNTAGPFLDVWSLQGTPLVIVEDCISAARVAQCGLSAVALLGTNMSHGDAKELRWIVDMYKHPTVFLALDNDATKKAMQYVSKFAHILPMMHFLPLQHDLKDTPDDDTLRSMFKPG